MARGEQCVMTPGTLWMLLWCADSWDVEELLVHSVRLFLGKERANSG